MLLLTKLQILVLRKLVRKYLRKFFLQEEVDQELVSPSTPSFVEVSADIPTSPESKSHEEKGPSLRIKPNHPFEVIEGNMNELTLRERTIDKCVASFVSYSCYLLQVEPTKVEDAL